MHDVILTVESAKLFDQFAQCQKEYIPIKNHINILSSKYKKNGVCILVLPIVTKGLSNQFIEHNYANNIKNNYENNYLVALTKKEYVNIIKNINTNDKLIKFYNYLENISWKNFHNSDQSFSNIIDNYSYLI